ncbi:MAG TPA: hypothetical protein VN538_12655 [Clostridia bacterium]|nr:hypothetical protein [Clostridia bacterium]
MSIEQLIKQLIDAIASVTWTPGTYPQSLAGIKTKPAGAWGVTTGTGQTTSTRRLATAETNVSLSVWSATPEARAAAKAACMDALTSIGFTALVPSDAEIVLEDQSTAYISNMLFRAWIDTVTGWVYQNQNS